MATKTVPAKVLLTIAAVVILSPDAGAFDGLAEPEAPDTVTIRITGHVKLGENDDLVKPLTVKKRIEANLAAIVEQAGGFAPFAEFAGEGPPTVAWIEREGDDQHILIDYRNRQILSQRKGDDDRWKIERYVWDTFEYQTGDFLFVCTSRKSLDLAFVPIRRVQDDGWEGFAKLNYVGKTEEETWAIDEAKARRAACEDKLPGTAVIVPDLDCGFFRTTKTSLPWWIIGEQGGKLEDTLDGSIDADDLRRWSTPRTAFPRTRASTGWSCARRSPRRTGSV